MKKSRILIVGVVLVALVALAALGFAADSDIATIRVTIAPFLAINLIDDISTITIDSLPVTTVAGDTLTAVYYCNKAAGYEVTAEQFAWAAFTPPKVEPFPAAGMQLSSGGPYSSTPIQHFVTKTSASAVGGDTNTINVQYNSAAAPLTNFTADTYAGTCVLSISNYTAP